MKTTIIAEIGLNHNGNMEMAKCLIDEAHRAGADIAKFQFFDISEYFGPEFEWYEECMKARIDYDKAEMSPMARSFYAENKRVSNELIKRELGVELKFPDYKAGLQSLL